MLHKERRSVTQHGGDHTGSFTQVRAAARRKTLLLLWWIDGGLWWKAQCSCPAGLPWDENGYACMSVQGSVSAFWEQGSPDLGLRPAAWLNQ